MTEDEEKEQKQLSYCAPQVFWMRGKAQILT